MYRKLLRILSLLLITSLLCTSCVELAAVVHMAKDISDNKETNISDPVMYKGNQGTYPIAQEIAPNSTYVLNPYTNKPVNVYGKPSEILLGRGKNKYYIPHLSQYPTAKRVKNKDGYFINPYDNKEISFKKAAPGTLVVSPTAGTFFYLPR